MYVTAPPLNNNNNTNNRTLEIEDLFNESTKSHRINNKTFNLGNACDVKNHYGKDRFSKYILSNYKSINFENFRPLLDIIANIVENY